MNPLLDQLAVVALILAALGYFAVRMLRKGKSGKSCGGCGSGATSDRRFRSK